ncbi:reverse transcriptase [Phytophthora megakarya]|uniref:Reverse transcriptase n=1 Tax=Phytophthora megakarya TaxID=4795 RepID=A0A225WKC2_9STRA|nr:reverse transcriptase [Phytophthora megakarya]
MVIKGWVGPMIGSAITSIGEGCVRACSHMWGEWVDCETGKGRPRIQAESPGNLQATYPFQIITMDHIPSLPISFKGNTELLIFVDLFSGEVVAKDSASRSAQTISSIRSWVNPNVLLWLIDLNLMDPKSDLAQRDWDEYTDRWYEYAKRLIFAINTARGRIRGETPFYMIHGWDPRSTLVTVIPVGSTRRHNRDPRRWQYQMQKYYQQAREQVNQRFRKAIADRADSHNDLVSPHHLEVGSSV